MTINYQRYLDDKVHQLRVVVRSQWDFLNYSSLTAWLEDNFGSDIEGKYYATKILLHTLYYKRTDIVKLIEYGLFEKIYGSIVKTNLIDRNNIFYSNMNSRI